MADGSLWLLLWWPATTGVPAEHLTSGPPAVHVAGNLNSASEHLACIAILTTSCSALGSRLRGYSLARAAARLAGMHLNRHAVFGACVISSLGVAVTGIGTDCL